MKKNFPFIQQRDRSECGTTCLAIIFKYYGLPNLQAILRERADVSHSGTNLDTLSEVAADFGFNAEGFKVEDKHLEYIDLPAIAHYEGNHFIIIYKVEKKYVHIVDPAIGKLRLTRAELATGWNGVILNLEPGQKLFQSDTVQEILATHRKQRSFLKNFYRAVLKPFRAGLVEILVASGILQLLGMTLPFFTQAILDKVIGNKHLELLFAILIGLCSLSLLQILLGYARSMLLARLKIKFELEFFSNLFRHLIGLKQKYFDSHKKEDFVNRFQENLKLRNIFSSSILQSFINILFLINFLVVLFLYNTTLSLIAIFFISMVVALTIGYTPVLRRLESTIFHKNEQTMGSFLDSLLGIQTVKLRGIEHAKLGDWKKRYTNALTEEFKAEKTYISLSILLGSVNVLSQIAVYWLGAYFALKDQLSIGQYIAFVSIYGLVMGSINTISGLWFMLLETSVTFEKLNDILIQPSEERGLLSALGIRRPELQFKGVNFKYYRTAETTTLASINLTIPFGQKIGIVGRNGSGKTTLVKLLTLLYPDYSGSILLNQQELREYSPETLRRLIYMLPQNIYLFNGTIKENINLVKPEAGNEEIISAARQADLHQFVSSLYLGYNHKVGDSGDNLSSGQRLKIALARLFLSDPEILILDEASSVLDGEAEQRIFTNIFQQFNDKTIFIIAHRLQTLKKLDRILVLNEGAIVEAGTHSELIAAGGYYYTLMKNYLEF